MAKRVLITGGAGFVGSHLADELLRHGYRVRALDSLSPQVHGAEAVRPGYLDPEIELVQGDLRDRELVRRLLRDVDAVYHLAAKVGVGQSMYQVAEYTAINNLATAILMEEIVDRRVERVVVASSMSIYGEGLYRGRDGALIPGTDRPLEQLKARDVLGYEPQVDFESGFDELAGWLETQIGTTQAGDARAELQQRDLTV